MTPKKRNQKKKKRKEKKVCYMWKTLKSIFCLGLFSVSLFLDGGGLIILWEH
jgi:hypothetical protein